MLAHLTTRTAFPRTSTLAIIRKTASSSGSKKTDESLTVSTPSGSNNDPNNSPMSQRPLPPDDGKVRK